MTSNQIAAREAAEKARHNQAEEKYKSREAYSNMARNESQTRLNKAQRAKIESETYDKGLNQAANMFQKLIAEPLGLAAKFATADKANNDPSWYNLDPTLVRDAANVAFGMPLGSATGSPDDIIPNGGVEGWTDALNTTTLPGAAIIRFLPTIPRTSRVGGMVGNADTVTLCARNIYTYVRHANSGHANYESMDLLMYLLAADSMYMYWSWLTRVYSIAMTAKLRNRYYPTSILTALKVNAGDVIANLAQLRTFINEFAVRANSIAVPMAMPLYRRHIWMVANIFKDAPIHKSQEYLFNPEYLYTLDIDPTTDATMLKPFAIADSNTWFTTNDLINMGNALLAPFFLNEDYGIMSGDIMKAYGDSGLMNLPQINENYHVESVFSLEVLSQITNAVTVGPAATGDGTLHLADHAETKPDGTTVAVPPLIWNLAIRQNTAKQMLYQGDFFLGVNPLEFIHTPIFHFAASCDTVAHTQDVVAYLKRVLATQAINMYKDDVTPDDVMVATRLTVIPTVNYDTTDVFSGSGTTTQYPCIATGVAECSTEIVTSISILGVDKAGNMAYWNTYNEYYRGASSGAQAFGYHAKYALSAGCRYDWFPRIRAWVYAYTGVTNSSGITIDTLQTANVVFQPHPVFRRLHEVASISLYGVPLLGTQKRR